MNPGAEIQDTRGSEETGRSGAPFPPVPLQGMDLHTVANRGRRRSPCPRLMSCGAPLAQGQAHRSTRVVGAKAVTGSRPGGTPQEISRGQVRAERTQPPVRRRNRCVPQRGIEETGRSGVPFPPVPLQGMDLHTVANRGRRRSPCPRLISCGAPLAQGHFRAAAFLRYRRRPRLRVRAASRCPALTFFSSGAGGLGPSGWDRVRWWGGLGRAQRVPTGVLKGGEQRFHFRGKPGRVRGVLWDETGFLFLFYED